MQKSKDVQERDRNNNSENLHGFKHVIAYDGEKKNERNNMNNKNGCANKN